MIYQITKRITDGRITVVLDGPDGHLEITATRLEGRYQTNEGRLLDTRGTLHDAAAELERELWARATRGLPPRRRGLLFSGACHG